MHVVTASHLLRLEADCLEQRACDVRLRAELHRTEAAARKL
jgi:hypothetical protein